MISGLKLYNGYNILDILTPGAVIEGSKIFGKVANVNADSNYEVIQITDKETGLITLDYKEVKIEQKTQEIPNIVVPEVENNIPNLIIPDPFIYKVKKRHQSFTSLDAMATYTTIILIVYGGYKIYNSIQ